MIMIQRRMQHVVENSLCPTQYGFRPQKSTSHAIYIIRRSQDFAEMKGAKLSMAMLDWEKAFDKIQHSKLIVALERMGFSKHYCDVIRNCYSKSTFFVKDMFGTSTLKKQNSGIRQGCPLSPYLFIIVMTCIDHDIRTSLSNRVLNNRLPGLNLIWFIMLTTLFCSQQTTVP